MNRRQLDAGGGFTLELFEVVGSRHGPVLGLLAGVHGDEPEGVLAIRMLLATLDESALAGTVNAVPIASPAAFGADTRLSPDDGKNLARVFPGSPGGSSSERIARLLTDEVIAKADLLIDLHSAGRDYEMPFFVGFSSTPSGLRERAARAAWAMGAPRTWEHSSVGPGRSISAAADLGVPSIYVEVTGGGTIRGRELQAVVTGIRRVMGTLGMLPSPSDLFEPPRDVFVGDDGDTDDSLCASAAGSCVRFVEVGQSVVRGQLLAEIVADDGSLVEQIVSPQDGVVMMLRRRPTVEKGTSIAMLGPRADASN